MSQPHTPQHEPSRVAPAATHAQPHVAAHEGPHEGPIKTPKQLIWAVIAAFVIPILTIILMANFVNFTSRDGAGSASMDPKSIAQRIAPVGRVEVRDAATTVARTGEQVYQAQCAACHAAGAAGAPKLGDAAAWAPRVATGLPALLNSVLKGKGAMAAQGGGDASDFEIERAVVHVANQSGAKFAEPQAPAAAASAPAAAASK